jgi:hypothetical protein
MNTTRLTGSMITHRRQWHVVLAIVWLNLISIGQGTPQSGDPLTHEGKTLYVHGFELNDQLRRKIKQIEERRDYSIMITSNGDGFYAKLSIEKQRLYLDELSIIADPDQFKGGVQVISIGKPRLFASWFTGELLRFYGRELGYTEEKGTVMRYKFVEGILISTKEEVLPRLKREGSADATRRPPPMPEAYKAHLRQKVIDSTRK